MTGPEDPDATLGPTPPGRPDPAASPQGTGAARGRRHDGAYDTARQHRALLDEIDHLRNEVRNRFSDHRVEVAEHLRHELGETNNHIAEILPRLHDLEDRVAELGAALRHGAAPPPQPTDATDPAGTRDADTDRPVATPSIGWNAMSRGDAERAWEALGQFVDEVLYRQYGLTRLQIPDCWPLHPRMIREIAWLRSTYLDAGPVEPAEPSAAMPWHIRCIPGFLINTADAVDLRECRPGVHRLTEAEVSRFAVAGQTARRDGGPEPLLTNETGHDRPHVIPAHYPQRVTKSTVSRRGADEGNNAPTVEGLSDFIVGACHPRYWRDHHRAATAADLAERT